MYEEVEITSPIDLAGYLANEGDLYFGPNKILLNTCGVSNFSIHFSHEDTYGGWLTVCGSRYVIGAHYFYKKLNWYDHVPEGKKVPCYVSNKRKPTVHDKVVLIESYHNDEKGCGFEDTNGTSWDRATPAPADELWLPEV